MAKISKSLNGDKVVHIAREGRGVVARADTIEELEQLLEARALALGDPPLVESEDEEDGRGTKETGRTIRSSKSKR